MHRCWVDQKPDCGPVWVGAQPNCKYYQGLVRFCSNETEYWEYWEFDRVFRDSQTGGLDLQAKSEELEDVWKVKEKIPTGSKILNEIICVGNNHSLVQLHTPCRGFATGRGLKGSQAKKGWAPLSFNTMQAQTISGWTTNYIVTRVQGPWFVLTLGLNKCNPQWLCTDCICFSPSWQFGTNSALPQSPQNVA